MALFRSSDPRPGKRPALQRDTLRLRLSDGSSSDVLRVRDPRARRMRLIVSDGRVRLTLPGWASARDGTGFLRQHQAWIEEQLRLQAARAASCAPLAFGDPGPVPLRGRSRELLWEPGLFARADLDPDGRLRITAPRQAGAAALGAALGALLEAEARRDVGQWLPRYLPSLPRAPLSVRIRPLASLWGSLSARDGLSLDLSLVLGPPAAFEYVLVHELCHLLHGDHSPRFWAAVAERVPGWKQQRDYLRRDGPALKSELKRLLGRV